MAAKSRWDAARPKKYVPEDPERPAACYCGTSAVMIPKSWVGKFTKSCGREGCNYKAMLETQQDGR